MNFFFRLMNKAVKTNNAVLFLVTILLTLFSSYFIHFLEPKTFPTIFDGFWWTMTTMTTVGYGDVSPVSIAGKLYTIFVVYPFGIGLLTVVIGKIIDYLSVMKKMREEGRMPLSVKNHVVIIGFSKKAEIAIDEILTSRKETEIVIVDSLEKAPMLSDRVHYIQGDATREETLIKAGVLEADSVLVFSDDKIEDVALKDDRTFSIASTIELLEEECDRNIITVAEIKQPMNEKRFYRANVDQVILSNQMVSALAVKTAFHSGSNKVINQLISQKDTEEDLFEIRKFPSWDTYRDAFEGLKNMGATFVSDGENLNIIQRFDEKLPEEAVLSVICTRATLDKINNNMSYE